MSFDNFHSAVRGEPFPQPEWSSVCDVPEGTVGYFWSAAITMFSNRTSVITDRTDVYSARVGDARLVKHRGKLLIQVCGDSMTEVVSAAIRPSYLPPSHLPVAHIGLWSPRG